jgi:Zn-finger protein
MRRQQNGERQTSILWHVDDCFISHLDEKVDKFIDELREE